VSVRVVARPPGHFFCPEFGFFESVFSTRGVDLFIPRKNVLTASLTSPQRNSPFQHLSQDVFSGLVVFLVALPLCLGISLASGAPLFSGIVAGIVGGILVGALSGSHTSVSGPAAGLTAVVAAQISALGSFDAFLTVVVLAGALQILLGILRAGFISAFFPSSVIKGLLAAIGVILILKQIPHVVGHDPDPEGEMSFRQTDEQNTFSAKPAKKMETAGCRWNGAWAAIGAEML